MTVDPVVLRYPFTGEWAVQNSPADRVPSHGTPRFALAYAIDFVPVTRRGRTAPFTFTSLVKPEPPERFPGFGRPILAPVAGEVVAVHDGEPDHDAFRGFPSVGYALTQGRRADAGWVALAGNYVMIKLPDSNAVVALCHLQRGSITVQPGDTVAQRGEIGGCGNSGNSTEPHVHLQAMTSPDPLAAESLPITFPDGLPRNRSIVRVAPERG